MNYLEYISNLFRGLGKKGKENKNSIDEDISEGENVSNSCTTDELVENKGSQLNLPKADIMKKEYVKRKNKKFLTTCKYCGHYRFARSNSNRIINECYPYEHSSRGGCNVNKKHHISAGEKYRRFCKCDVCIEAALLFHSKNEGEKKRNQYSYPRTKEQEMAWKEMKKQGWYCRQGLYFRPGVKCNLGLGVSVEEAFRDL